MKPMLKDCPGCLGSGIVARARPFINGVIDQFDTRTIETCAPCGGSGKVVDKGPAAEKPLAAIDGGDCCV